MLNYQQLSFFKYIFQQIKLIEFKKEYIEATNPTIRQHNLEHASSKISCFVFTACALDEKEEQNKDWKTQNHPSEPKRQHFLCWEWKKLVKCQFYTSRKIFLFSWKFHLKANGRADGQLFCESRRFRIKVSCVVPFEFEFNGG